MPRRAPNGRPSIAKGRDGYWHAWVDFGRDPTTGKRLRTHVKKATRKAAAAAVAELETERATGVRRAPGSLGEWLDGWLAGVESSRKPSTARSYQGHARCYIVPRLGTIPLNSLTTEDVEAMLAWCVSPSGPAISAVTAESVRRTLRAALNEAVRRGRLVRNPAQWARSPRGPVVEVDTIALSDIPAIVAQLGGNPMRARWLLALTTGMRQGEVLALRRADVDVAAGVVHVTGSLTRGTWRHGCVDPAACAARRCRTTPCPQPCSRHTRPCPKPCPTGCTGHARGCPNKVGGGLIRETTKSGSRRTVPVADGVLAALREHLRVSAEAALSCGRAATANDYLFCHAEDGRPINPRDDWGRWGKLLAAAGVRHYRVHSARHFVATQVLADGTDIKTIMALLGWSSPALATHYAHAVEENGRRAASRIAAVVLGTAN
jgi:integrase